MNLPVGRNLHYNTVHSCFLSKHFGPYVGRLTRPFATSHCLSLRGGPWSAVAAATLFLIWLAHHFAYEHGRKAVAAATALQGGLRPLGIISYLEPRVPTGGVWLRLRRAALPWPPLFERRKFGELCMRLLLIPIGYGSQRHQPAAGIYRWPPAERLNGCTEVALEADRVHDVPAIQSSI